jgi:hypothetical protein
MSKIERAVCSVLIASAASFAPLFIPFASFLLVPGAILTLLLFGQKVPLTSQAPRILMNLIVWSIALYFGVALWKWGQTNPTRQMPTAAKGIFIFWLVLVIPWLLLAPLSGMAFDAGYTSEAYAFVWSVWTYPITVGIVALCRRWVPWIVLLPILNIVGCGASELLHK